MAIINRSKTICSRSVCQAIESLANELGQTMAATVAELLTQAAGKRETARSLSEAGRMMLSAFEQERLARRVEALEREAERLEAEAAALRGRRF